MKTLIESINIDVSTYQCELCEKIFKLESQAKDCEKDCLRERGCPEHYFDYWVYQDKLCRECSRCCLKRYYAIPQRIEENLQQSLKNIFDILQQEAHSKF